MEPERAVGAREGGPPEVPPASEAPWIETRAGGMFFVNAVLAAPVLMTLYPWTLRWILRAVGVLNRPSKVLDPVPAVADHLIPVLGWFALPAAWLVVRNLRIVERPWPRRLLWLFLAVHAGTVVYTVGKVLG